MGSTRALVDGTDDGITDTASVLQRVPRFTDLLAPGPDEDGFTRLRRAEIFGRPLGNPGFLARLEAATGRSLAAAKRGRKPKDRANTP